MTTKTFFQQTANSINTERSGWRRSARIVLRGTCQCPVTVVRDVKGDALKRAPTTTCGGKFCRRTSEIGHSFRVTLAGLRLALLQVPSSPSRASKSQCFERRFYVHHSRSYGQHRLNHCQYSAGQQTESARRREKRKQVAKLRQQRRRSICGGFDGRRGADARVHRGPRRVCPHTAGSLQHRLPCVSGSR